MRKNFKEWAKEVKEIESLESLDSAKMASLNSEYMDYVGEEAVKAALSKYGESEEGIKKLEEHLSKLEAKAKEQGLELQKLKDKEGLSPAQVSTKEFVDGALKAARAWKDSSIDSFVQKATVTRATVVNNGLALDLPDVGQLGYQLTTFLSFLESRGRVLPAGKNGQIRYIDWDDATKVRAANMIAEGGTFPESTAAWQTYTKSLKKVGDTIPWTDEFGYDDNFLVQELSNFLRVNLMLKKSNQVINGDNTGENLDGIVNQVSAYVPAASGITDASLYDLFVKIREAIEKTKGSKYRTDFALLNITDINKYKLKKDANNNYVMPPFVSAEGKLIDGITVIEDNEIAANTAVFGDSRYLNLWTAPGMGIETGYINDDFSKGQKRMRVYERLLFIIRQADRDGFLKVTDLDAALVTLATAIP